MKPHGKQGKRVYNQDEKGAYLAELAAGSSRTDAVEVIEQIRARCAVLAPHACTLVHVVLAPRALKAVHARAHKPTDTVVTRGTVMTRS